MAPDRPYKRASADEHRKTEVAPNGYGPGGSTEWVWDFAHLRYLILPAATLCVIPLGIITRTDRLLSPAAKVMMKALKTESLAAYGRRFEIEA